MKKKMIAIVLTGAMLMAVFAGCSKNDTQAVEPAAETAETEETVVEKTEEVAEEETVDKTEISDEEAQTEEAVEGAYAASFQIEDSVTQYTGRMDDGTCLYIVNMITPNITSSDHSDIADAIGTAISDRIGIISDDMLEMFGEAEADYQERYEYAENPEDFYWSPYELDLNYEVKDYTDKTLSILITSYSYYGGAHGGESHLGMTFDLETGEVLSLSDLSADGNEQTLRDAVNAAISDQCSEIAADPDGDPLFSDYEDSIQTILDGESWYLTSEGFEVIAEQYAIAPYAFGCFTFTIPYSDCDFLNKTYADGEGTKIVGAQVWDVYPDYLDDGIYYVSFDPENVVDTENGLEIRDVILYTENCFDIVDVNTLSVGDVLYVAPDYYKVVTFENVNGVKMINGGIEEGGTELVTREDTNGYFFCGFDDITSYTNHGIASGIVIDESVQYTDNSDLDNQVTAGYSDLKDTIQSASLPYFNEYNTTIRTENQKIVEINRSFRP